MVPLELNVKLRDLLGKAFIWPTVYPLGDLVHIVMKKDTKIHLCIYYTHLQKVIVKNHYHIPIAIRPTSRC